jgi:hypothetical protein
MTSIDERLHRGDSELTETDPHPEEGAPGGGLVSPTPSNSAIGERAAAARAARGAGEEKAEPEVDARREFVGELPPLPPPLGTKSLTTADEPDGTPAGGDADPEVGSDAELEDDPRARLAGPPAPVASVPALDPPSWLTRR